MKNTNKLFVFVFCILTFCTVKLKAQYVQPERDDTIRLYAKTPFEVSAAKKALDKGTATVKGVAFTRKAGYMGGFAFGLTGLKSGEKIVANKIIIYLFPVTPYLIDYLSVKKKENPKKLKFAFIDPNAWYYKLTALTNSAGEFTFPHMKPGKYYLEAVLPWDEQKSYNEFKGTAYGSYGTSADYYERKYYIQSHYDKLTKFIEIKTDGEILEVKLK